MGEKSPIRPQTFHTDDADLSGICQRALIGRLCNSNFILLAVVCEWQIKHKRSQRSKVNANNRLKNSLSHETPLVTILCG